MKAGWQWKLLGDVCKTGSGGTPIKAKEEYYKGGTIPWLMSGEVSQGEVREATNFITQKGLENSAAKIFPKDTVLVAMYGATAGQVGILKFEAATNQAVCGILPNKQFVPKFLFYFLLSRKDELVAQATGNAQPNISQIKIKNTDVPILALLEQQRIVGILDEAFDGIATAKANAEKNLKNARALFESHLQSIFSQHVKGWKRVRIEEACESIIDCVNKTATKVDWPTPFKMIRTTNVRNGRVNLDTVNFVTEEIYRIWTRRQVPQRGDVILTREAPMGEVGMLLSDDNIFLGQRLVSYRANPVKLNNHFLLYALQSGDLQGQIHALASGSTVQHMRVPDSKNLQLPLPSLKEQEETVATLNSLREETQHLESIYKQKLAALDELKKSLLYQAFSGEL